MELGSVLSSLLEVVFELHLTVEEQGGTLVQELFVEVLGPYWDSLMNSFSHS